MGRTMRLTPLGKAAAVLMVVVALYGIYALVAGRLGLPMLFSGDEAAAPAPMSLTPASGAETVPAAGSAEAGLAEAGSVPDQVVEIGIAYGTEKERWLKDAVEAWAKTPEGAAIKVNLIPLGSVEGAQAILAGDERITVWSPASALYKAVFVQEWQLKNGTNPILREESLALSPIVFVMWEERYEAFREKYGAVTFKTLAQGLAETGGWQAIAGKPEWGLFKVGHTHPNQSNSGLMTLVLMAYDFQGKSRDLVLADILDVDFQNWMAGFERAVSGLANSTGNMMREMVLKGPSSFDALVVYENVAIDYLQNAEGRWGRLHVAYPAVNMWNDNPYYILNAPWITPEEQAAADRFLEFLLSEPIQQAALQHGFRPGNPAVPVKFPDSPFVRYAPYGLQVDLTTIAEPPPAEVITNLLGSWQRSQGPR